MADGFEHAANLAVPSFGDRELDDRGVVPPAGVDQLGACGLRAVPIERDAPAQPVKGALIRHAGHARLVGALHAVTRVRQRGRQVAIVGQNQQPLGVVVEAADGIQVVGQTLDEVHDGPALLWVAPGRHVAPRLVEQDVAPPGVGLDPPPVDLDLIAVGVGLGAEFAHGMSVNLHAALDDKRFGGPARCHASPREYFL